MSGFKLPELGSSVEAPIPTKEMPVRLNKPKLQNAQSKVALPEIDLSEIDPVELTIPTEDIFIDDDFVIEETIEAPPNVPEEALVEEAPVSLPTAPKRKLSFAEKIKSELGEGAKADERTLSDEEAVAQREEIRKLDEATQKRKEQDDKRAAAKAGKIKPKKKKTKNPLVRLYKKIGSGIITGWTGVVDILRRIPVIKLFGYLLSLLTPIVKLISIIWLPFIIALAVLITYFSGGFATAQPGQAKISGQEVMLKAEETKVQVLYYEPNDGNTFDVGVKNDSDMFADFTLLATPKTGLFEKKSAISCFSEVTVLDLGETKRLSLKCSEPIPEHQKMQFELELS